jgi:cell division protein FtsB
MDENEYLEKLDVELQKNNSRIEVLQQTLVQKELEIRDAKDNFNRESNELSRQIIHEKVTLENESGIFRKRLQNEIYERASKLVDPLKKEIYDKSVFLVDAVRKYETDLKSLSKEKQELEEENRKFKRDSMLNHETVLEYAREGMYHNRDVSSIFSTN